MSSFNCNLVLVSHPSGCHLIGLCKVLTLEAFPVVAQGLEGKSSNK